MYEYGLKVNENEFLMIIKLTCVILSIIVKFWS